MMKRTLTRLLAVFVAAAIPNVLVGSGLLDVDLWRSTVMAGAVAVLGVVQQLAVTYKNDGELTEDDVDAAISKGA
tara:strand:- start:253 stop:477 length:225 start_codon:yes stop_codon:yes gene_type:complete